MIRNSIHKTFMRNRKTITEAITTNNATRISKESTLKRVDAVSRDSISTELELVSSCTLLACIYAQLTHASSEERCIPGNIIIVFCRK